MWKMFPAFPYPNYMDIFYKIKSKMNFQTSFLAFFAISIDI